MNKLGFFGALLCLAAAATPAGARDQDWRSCLQDLYGVRARAANPVLGRAGIVACEAALNDPVRPGDASYSRAVALQARALHRLATGDDRDALLDLDLADEVATAPDIFWRRSFSPGNSLLRAFARLRSGDETGVVELSRAATSARVFDVDLAMAAARLELAATHNLDNYVATLRGLARLDPSRIPTLYVIALSRLRFDDAIALYPHILFTVPEGRGEYRILDAAELPARNLLARTELAGSYAYALAATGQPERASEVFTLMDRVVQQAMVRPVYSAALMHLQPQWRAFLARRDEMEDVLARYRNLVDLRLRPADPATAQSVASIIATPDGGNPVVLDLAVAVRRAQPAGTVLSEDMIRLLQAHQARELAGLEQVTLRDIQLGLPQPEWIIGIPEFDGGTDSGFMGVTESGHMSRPGPAGSTTVKYMSTTGTGATASALAFLRAAQLAREQGKPGFIVVGRRLVPRSTQRPDAAYPSGYEAELDVVFVDPDALPDRYAEASWRVVDAGAVLAEFESLYTDQRTAMREAARAR